jgi:hypothetical protein
MTRYFNFQAKKSWPYSIEKSQQNFVNISLQMIDNPHQAIDSSLLEKNTFRKCLQHCLLYIQLFLRSQYK